MYKKPMLDRSAENIQEKQKGAYIYILLAARVVTLELIKYNINQIF